VAPGLLLERQQARGYLADEVLFSLHGSSASATSCR
jgi:hypothetical protein